MKKLLALFVAVFLCIGLYADVALPVGEGVFTYKDYPPFADRPVDVHYYIPVCGDVRRMPVVFVFEGADRGYGYLLKGWKQEAEKNKFMVFIPHFDKEKYPLADYQEIGMLDKKKDGTVRPLQEQTPALVDKLFEYVRCHLGSERKGYIIYGHSAGGQFVQRFMLFHDSPYVEKAVIGSPGWYTFPDTAQDFPYGVGNIPYVTTEVIRKYLAKPIVLQLATGDTVRESYLRKTPEAERQGRNRYERGNRFYQYLHQIAVEHGWQCNWRKIEEHGIGHQSVEMGQRAVHVILEDSLPVLFIGNTPSLWNILPLAQPEAVTNRFYPEPEKEYSTPTLGKPAGEGLASLFEITRYLQGLAAKHPDKVTLSDIGGTPQGRNIPILYFGKPNQDKKIRVWIQAGLHGNEPAGPEVACLLADYLLNTPEGSALLKKVSLALIPVANVDGYAGQSRKSGCGLDLNRDQSKLSDPVTLFIKQAYKNWNPEIALDIHEFNPFRRELEVLRGTQVAVASDVLFLPSGHLNIPAGIRRLSNGLFREEAEKALKNKGYSSGFYFTPSIRHDSLYAIKDAKSPQSSSTFQALTNTISLFIEIRGIGLERTSFARRAECGFLVARSLLQTAALHTKIIRNTIRRSIKETCQGEKNIYVTFQSTHTEYPVSFIDLCKNERFTVILPTLDALQLRAGLVRKRPKAYILPDTCLAQAKKLSALGIEVERAEKAFTAIVEKYIVTSYEKASKEWEKIHPVTVSTRLEKEKRNFPAGSFIVRLSQKNANLAVTLLEPESLNGFVNFAVIRTGLGEELPVYRLRAYSSANDVKSFSPSGMNISFRRSSTIPRFCSSLRAFDTLSRVSSK